MEKEEYKVKEIEQWPAAKLRHPAYHELIDGMTPTEVERVARAVNRLSAPPEQITASEATYALFGVLFFIALWITVGVLW